MAWEAEYSHKLATAAEALRVIESGMRVFVHASSGFPLALVEWVGGSGSILAGRGDRTPAYHQ